MTFRTDRYSGGTAQVLQERSLLPSAPAIGTPYCPTIATGVLPRFRKPTAQVLSQVKESFESEVVIGVGGQSSKFEDVRKTSHDVHGTQRTCQRLRSTCLGIQVDVQETSSNVLGDSGGVPKTSSTKGGSFRGQYQ
ncbi:unnamed protein product [Heligmosomoides polygyrus]|uniref:Uncharacterized protein n=1 Tax=Heligmosomoides polygyrus TaxID=6339 RepID=A0A183FYI2_HELPZ|nr:unnamed protein product [Heligmosomoides polygyrus]